jgi:hypothetical protein
MSASSLACRTCKVALGSRHHSGRLTVSDGVGVVVVTTGERAPYLVLICRCGTAREYRLSEDYCPSVRSICQPALSISSLE